MKTKYSLMISTAIICAASLLSGCASIVDGSNESVSVSTPPAKGATCKLTNSKGTWYVNKTPGSTTVHRAYGDMKVTCKKSGYKSGKKDVKSKTKGMAFGNVVFGGVIGADVDMANGSAYDYPTNIIVPMQKGKG